MTNDLEKLQALNRVKALLSTNDQNFANSLMNQWREYKRLSPKQWEWVVTLTSRGIEKSQPKTQEAGFLIPHYENVVQMINRAAKSLLDPTIKIWAENEMEISIKRNKRDTSEHSLYGKYPSWFGNIKQTISGYVYYPSRGTSEAPIVRALTELAKNPEEFCKLLGQKYEICCFCSLTLTNASSRHYGYGPICAGNWGLPWGDVPLPEEIASEVDRLAKEIEL